MKYVIVFLSALIIEISSIFFISYVSERNLIGMVVFAFLGPLLSLPFTGFMVESGNWVSRIKLAICLSIGYSVGAVLVYIFKF